MSVSVQPNTAQYILVLDRYEYIHIAVNNELFIKLNNCQNWLRHSFHGHHGHPSQGNHSPGHHGHHTGGQHGWDHEEPEEIFLIF